MKQLILVAAAAVLAGGCVPTTYQTLAVSCSDFIGQPISTRIAAYGPPRAVRRISPTRIGYVFETRETSSIGGERYYTVNYLVGSEKHHRPIRPVTTACTGTFIVQAPSDALPPSERIIVDIVPAI